MLLSVPDLWETRRFGECERRKAFPGHALSQPNIRQGFIMA